MSLNNVEEIIADISNPLNTGFKRSNNKVASYLLKLEEFIRCL